MSEQADERPEAIREIEKTIIAIVRDSPPRPDGVHLTWVGGEFARLKNAPFEQYVSFLVLRDGVSIPPELRRMVPFIETYCANHIQLEKHANGTIIVSERPGATIADVPPMPNKVERVAPYRRFKKSVWVAFFRPLAPGQRRYLGPERTVFSDLEGGPPTAEWREVPASYIVVTPPDQPLDVHLIQESIAKWAAATNTLMQELTLEDHPFPAPGASLADLARVVASVPSALASQWMIPAEVLRHLRRT